jgi:hypothetical protein
MSHQVCIVCVDLIGCNAVLTKAFRRNILPPSSDLNFRTYTSTRRHNSEGQHPHIEISEKNEILQMYYT